MDKEVIVSAAHYEPELDVIIPCVRHEDNIFYEHFILQCEKHPELDSIFWEQGFMTNKSRYVDRNEAMRDDTLVRTYICIAEDRDFNYPERGLAVVKYLSPSELTEGAFGDYNKALFKHFNIDKE